VKWKCGDASGSAKPCTYVSVTESATRRQLSQRQLKRSQLIYNHNKLSHNLDQLTYSRLHLSQHSHNQLEQPDLRHKPHQWALHLIYISSVAQVNRKPRVKILFAPGIVGQDELVTYNRHTPHLPSNRPTRALPAQPAPSPPELHDYGGTEAEQDRSNCAQCGSENNDLDPCTKCANVAYCDKDCAGLHWTTTHKYKCSLGRPLDEADYLVRACQDNKFPTDDDVGTAFGFRHFATAHHRLQLFAICRALVENAGLNDQELRDALQAQRVLIIPWIADALLP
jgi:hypothetical protein